MWNFNGRRMTDDGQRTPSDGKSSHCLWQGELMTLTVIIICVMFSLHLLVIPILFMNNDMMLCVVNIIYKTPDYSDLHYLLCKHYNSPLTSMILHNNFFLNIKFSDQHFFSRCILIYDIYELWHLISNFFVHY